MVPSSIAKIAEEYGVKIHTSSHIKKILIEKGIASGIELASGEKVLADIVVSNADTHFTDTVLLDDEYRTKSDAYWDKLKLAPSAFIMYLGVKGKLPNLSHHNLIFSENWDKNFTEIFDKKVWCTDPSLYICCPSKTDSNVAPEDHENLFVLVPIAAGLKYDEKYIADYRKFILKDIAKHTKTDDLEERIVYEKIFTVDDFVENYNAHKGTALGPAHTLLQTAFFRSNNTNPKVKNLFYVGAGTNPGIGMPICIISAELAYKRILGINSNEPLVNL
jgi:phytoene desaturase